jgi:adenosylcobinamide kinase/adenosylcobinamide-phosphate guanylyltransferase
LVSNEVGMGIVPLGEINRRFQDEQGRLNQAVARIADTVTFVAAGLPLKLKG